MLELLASLDGKLSLILDMFSFVSSYFVVVVIQDFVCVNFYFSFLFHITDFSSMVKGNNRKKSSLIVVLQK